MKRGENTHFHHGLEVLVYTLMHRDPPTRNELAERFNVSPKTAWRWKRDLDVIHSLYQIKRRTT